LTLEGGQTIVPKNQVVKNQSKSPELKKSKDKESLSKKNKSSQEPLLLRQNSLTTTNLIDDFDNDDLDLDVDFEDSGGSTGI